MGEFGQAMRALERSLAYLGVPGSSADQRQFVHYGFAFCHLLRGDVAAAQRHLLRILEEGSNRASAQLDLFLLQAQIAAAQGQDPSDWLRQARGIAAPSPFAKELFEVTIEASAASCGIHADDPQALLALEQRARAIEQGGLATRMAWYRVDALRRSGNAAAAALRARELLDQPLWPTMLLPCHWLWIAHAALAAAGDPQAPAVAARASEAHAMTLKDLGSLSGPPASWPGPWRAWQLAAVSPAVLA
jgi:hypothetical protein